MTNQDIIDYVQESPNNTNPVMLNQLLNQLVEEYSGDYEVSPDFIGRTLVTNNKKMTADVVVKPIEVQRVSNPQNGRTIYIGGLING